MSETLFIINPQSARGLTLKTWAAARRRLVERRLPFREHLTTRAGDATETARRALAEGCERVIAVGGDGTLNEVLNGYLDGEGRPVYQAAAIGLLPSGTGDDFRRSLGGLAPRNLPAMLAAPQTRWLDAGRIEFTDPAGRRRARFFMNVATFGLGGEVSDRVNRWRGSLPRWVGGRARFMAAAVCALMAYRNTRVAIDIDGEERLEIRSNLLIVANGRFAGGGMMLAPNARLDDGWLDLITTDGVTRLDIVRELPGIGRGAHLRNPRVAERRVRRIDIHSAGWLPIDLDGDMVGFTPARIEVLPAAVQFIL